jgi:catechol 2,3-dioxygenase-like lactoylglutathione lyase family enzyme/ketosteroid isomerase-like protein
MIRLEHANLVVNDIPATLEFIQTAFPSWKVRGQGEMTWYGKPRRWLHVGSDDSYLTLNGDGEGENRDLSGHAPGLAHLGFVVDDVDGVIERLEAKGYRIDVELAEHPFRKNVYFVDPAGFQFEFMEYLSEEPGERNSYVSSATIKIDAGNASENATEAARSPQHQREKNMPAIEFIDQLYKNIDDKNLPALSELLSDDVVFQLGNHDPLAGKQAVLDANDAFFKSIRAMEHAIDGVWAVGENMFCDGHVHYTRLDGSKLTIPFATILAVKNDLIRDYKIYVDVSPL